LFAALNDPHESNAANAWGKPKIARFLSGWWEEAAAAPVNAKVVVGAGDAGAVGRAIAEEGGVADRARILRVDPGAARDRRAGDDDDVGDVEPAIEQSAQAPAAAVEEAVLQCRKLRCWPPGPLCPMPSIAAHCVDWNCNREMVRFRR